MKLFYGLVFLSLILAVSTALNRNHPRFGKLHTKSESKLFERFFNWNEVYFTVNHNSETIKFPAKIKADAFGLNFEEDKSEAGIRNKDSTKFYKNVIVFREQTPVIDYRLIQVCKFEENKNIPMFTGYTFKFSVAGSEHAGETNYDLEVSYKLGAGLLGGVKFDQVLSELEAQCRKRQDHLQEKRGNIIKQADKLHEELEKETRIHTEIKDVEDRVHKLKEDLMAEENKKAILRAKLAAESKAVKELSDEVEGRKAEFIKLFIEGKESPKRFVQEVTRKAILENKYKSILEKIIIKNDAISHVIPSLKPEPPAGAEGAPAANAQNSTAINQTSPNGQAPSKGKEDVPVITF